MTAAAAARLALLELFGRGHLPPGYSRWDAATLTVDVGGPMPAGIDSEPAAVEPPLRFATRPAALVVRLPLAPRPSPARRLVEESRHLVRAVYRPGRARLTCSS